MMRSLTSVLCLNGADRARGTSERGRHYSDGLTKVSRALQPNARHVFIGCLVYSLRSVCRLYLLVSGADPTRPSANRSTTTARAAACQSTRPETTTTTTAAAGSKQSQQEELDLTKETTLGDDTENNRIQKESNKQRIETFT